MPEGVEPAEAAPEQSRARPQETALPGWFWIGIGVALLGSCVWSAVLNELYRRLGRETLAAVVVVAVYVTIPALFLWRGIQTIDRRRN